MTYSLNNYHKKQSKIYIKKWFKLKGHILQIMYIPKALFYFKYNKKKRERDLNTFILLYICRKRKHEN
jgi:hypothetical protein